MRQSKEPHNQEASARERHQCHPRASIGKGKEVPGGLD